MNRLWDEARDAPRIRHAFLSLAATARKWPAPAELWDHLPKLEAQLALPAKITDPKTAEARIREIQDILGVPPRQTEPKSDEPRRPLAEVESILRRHYTDQKSKAAGEGGNDDATDE